MRISEALMHSWGILCPNLCSMPSSMVIPTCQKRWWSWMIKSSRLASEMLDSGPVYEATLELEGPTLTLSSVSGTGGWISEWSISGGVKGGSSNSLSSRGGTPTGSSGCDPNRFSCGCTMPCSSRALQTVSLWTPRKYAIPETVLHMWIHPMKKIRINWNTGVATVASVDCFNDFWSSMMG